MNTKWLIENSLFEEETPRLIAALEKAEIEYQVFINDITGPSCKFQELGLDNKSPVVYYGPLETGYQIKHGTIWVPGVYTTMENYKCSKYYTHFGYWIANQDYFIIPLGELQRRLPEIKEYYLHKHNTKHVFIRPDKGTKLFTGFCAVQTEAKSVPQAVCDTETTVEVYYKDIEYVLDFLQVYDMNPEGLIVVGPRREIWSEWRFVVADNKIVGQVCYKRALHKYKPLMDFTDVYEDGTAYGAVEAILLQTKYRPDRVFTIDMCLIGRKPCILEINGFSSAGLYGMDWTDVVGPVSQAAQEEWDEYYA